MKWKTVFVFSLFLFFLSGSLYAVFGQNTQPDLVALSTNSLTLAGKVGNNRLATTMNIVGVANETVNVALFSTELHDNNSGKMILASKMAISPSNFTLSWNELVEVAISENISETDAGTYRGVIIATAIGDGQIVHMNINVAAVITEVSFTSQPSNILFIIILGILVVLFLAVLWLGSRGESKFPGAFGQNMPLIVVILTIFALSLWIYILFNYHFDVLSTIATIIIVPLGGYVTNYLNERRKDSNEKTKTSQGVNSKGIEKDIETIRSILGELATHYASFKPNLYEETDGKKKAIKVKDENKEFEPLAKAMFIKNGIISRKVWDSVCKQGMMADLPVLELEKYYDYVNLYNQYYSYALKLTSDIDQETFVKQTLDDTHFLGKFEKLQDDFANVEKILFVNLTYYLGLFIETYLYQEKPDYPRITRTLLKKLLEYGILVPEDFSKACKRAGLKVSEKELEQAYNESTRDRTYNEPLDEFKKETRKMCAEEVINEWKMTASELEQLVKKMYDRNNIPKFYRIVEDDFQVKYDILKKSIANLEPPIFTHQEDMLALAEKLDPDKPVDFLETLKKLFESGVIDKKKFNQLKNRIFEKQQPEHKGTSPKQSSSPSP